MKISDVIEQFILEVIGDESCAEISRNELAAYFKCAPSQINYVLATRFTVDRGYQIESRRGGGGYIRIEKIQFGKAPYLSALLDSTNQPTSYTRVMQIAENLTSQGIISPEEASLLTTVTTDKALAAPANLADSIRSNILRETIIHLIKR